MNRIFIIAHAPLAHALREIALHVFPDSATDVVALDVQSGVQPEDTLTQAENMMGELSKTGQKDSKKGVILLCDILGATPCNVATQLAEKYAAKLVVGVNVPMLLRVLTYKHETLDQLVTRALAGGAQGVMAVAMTAPQHQSLKRHDQNQHDHQQ